MTDQPPLNPADIDTAPPVLTEVNGALPADEVEIWREKFIDLSSRYEALEITFDTYRRREKAGDILNTLIVPYSDNIFKFMVFYSVFVGCVLLMNSGGRFPNPISDTVMSFLVGSTATTVLGLVGMIVGGIFTGARKAGD